MQGKDTLITGARYVALGFEFGGTIVVALLVGYWLDQRLGTAPLFMILLIAGGMAGALRRLLWSLKRNT